MAWNCHKHKYTRDFEISYRDKDATGADKTNGTHTGSAHATVMTDSTGVFVPNALIGKVITNTVTDGWGVITANTATTITVASLSTGQWSNGDGYRIWTIKVATKTVWGAENVTFNFPSLSTYRIRIRDKQNPVDIGTTTWTSINDDSGTGASLNQNITQREYTHNTVINTNQDVTIIAIEGSGE